ncbi:MAG: energy-coupled thiamine transporter ThiT [Firmicutes bacterium]|nr:energy-coupled thiamine transporter ThiT [Bacillota bacterium]
MKNEKVKILVEGGICLGLAIVLGLFSLFTMPQGGSISLATLPIVIFSMRNGWKSGVLVGLVYGILQMIMGPIYSVHPISIICDYLLVGAILGLIIYQSSNFKFIIRFFLVFILRYLSYVLSGVVVFSSYAGDQNPIIYSLVYNSFALVEAGVVLIVILILKNFSPIFKK